MMHYTESNQAVLAFESVMLSYQEKSTSRLPTIVNYETSVVKQGKSTHTGQSWTVKPSQSDFLADVEIAARRALTAYQHSYFVRFYQTAVVVVTSRKDQLDDGEDRSLKAHLKSFQEDERSGIEFLDRSVRTRLGQRFIEVGLFPLSVYNAAVDTSKRMVRGVITKTSPKLAGKPTCMVLVKAA